MGLPGATLVSPSLATAVLPSPYDRKFPTDDTGTRWMNVPGPTGTTMRIRRVYQLARSQSGEYEVFDYRRRDRSTGSMRRSRKFRTRLTTALALVGLGLLGVTVFQVRFGLLPLRQHRARPRRYSLGRSRHASKGSCRPKIEPLQTELNALIGSNQEIIDRARTQVGNLAHALKTPLAVITNEARDDKTALGAKVAEQAQMMRDRSAISRPGPHCGARRRHRPGHATRTDRSVARQGR